MLQAACVPLLGKTYVVQAGMYGDQVWGTDYLRRGHEVTSEFQVRHKFERALWVSGVQLQTGLLLGSVPKPLPHYSFR